LYPSGISGEKRSLAEHSPGRDHHQKYELLKQRFAEFGAEGVLFLDELVRTRRRGKDEAGRVLGLLAAYHRDDLVRALQRAVRYRAFSWSAVERILAAQARPRSGWESLQAEAQDQLDEILRQSPVWKRVGLLLDVLGRMEVWLAHRGRAGLTAENAPGAIALSRGPRWSAFWRRKRNRARRWRP
jgi:hypothetical protein